MSPTAPLQTKLTTRSQRQSESKNSKQSKFFCVCNVQQMSQRIFFFLISQRNSLSEVTACLRERLHRWQHIERLCGFPIIRNPGLANLTAQLYSDSVALGLPRVPQSSCSYHSSLQGSIEDLLEESDSPVLSQMPGRQQTCFILHYSQQSIPSASYLVSVEAMACDHLQLLCQKAANLVNVFKCIK